VRPTAGLALQALLDEVLIAAFRHPDLLPRPGDYEPAAADLASTRELFAARGWLEHPTRYHRSPPAPEDVQARHEHALGLVYEHASFTSDWEPDPEEPGRSRWLEHEANRTMHAWVARAPGRDNGMWMVCVHGFGMGANASMDMRAFRVTQLHRRGINVVMPVLPLHGARASGRVRGEDLMTIDLVDSMHGIAQATWDVRRVIRWLREAHGAERVGVIGYSLGSLVAALVAALEDDLACVIAGIPVVDLPKLFRRHSPPHIARLAEGHGALGPAADDVHRVVSPLAMECRVPFERRFIFAGLGDRMSTFGEARRLWLHWNRPTLATYAGAHVGFYFSGAVKQLVDDAISSSYPPVIL
jgi:pimeloyl-ACP methyl ester carboxylesterase